MIKKILSFLLLFTMIVLVSPFYACQVNNAAVREPVPPTFQVGNLQIFPATCKISDNVTISADIANNGELAGEYNAQLKINGTTAQTSAINVPAGSISSVTFKMSPNSPGNYNIAIGDQVSNLQVIAPVPATLKLSNLQINPARCKISDNVTITADIANSGELAGRYIAELKINGNMTQTSIIDVPAGSVSSVTFKMSPNSPGNYSVTIGDQASNLEVISPIPATFKLSNLQINPVACFTTDNVVITADIANTGELQGKYTAGLKINGVTVQIYETLVMLPGMSSFVVFKIPASSAGIYTVSIGDLTGQFTVTQAPIPIQLPSIGFGCTSSCG